MSENNRTKQVNFRINAELNRWFDSLSEVTHNYFGTKTSKSSLFNGILWGFHDLYKSENIDPKHFASQDTIRQAMKNLLMNGAKIND